MKSVAVFAIFVISCSVCAERQVGGTRELLLTIEEGERPDQPIGKAEVIVVYENGATKTVSRADAIGIAKIDKSDLINGLFVIVCCEGYYCGAIDLNKDDLRSFDIYSIYLSTIRF